MRIPDAYYEVFYNVEPNGAADADSTPICVHAAATSTRSPTMANGPTKVPSPAPSFSSLDDPKGRDAVELWKSDGTRWTFSCSRDCRNTTTGVALARCQFGSTRAKDLVGAIPTDVGELSCRSRIDSFYITSSGRNRLNGTLDALASLTALTELVVAGMDLGGVVDAISTLTNLRVLALQENKFGGKLDALSSLRRLTFVSIEDNMFEVRGPYTCVSCTVSGST